MAPRVAMDSHKLLEYELPATVGAAKEQSPGQSLKQNGNPMAQHETLQELQDLICVGFGPASLAIAIALQERSTNFLGPASKVSFLERQSQFAWHSGMQLPGAKMQISFLKDLATPRNPQSQFTFLNYLYQKNRLNHFINLGTFLPTRLEYEDYLRWCASHFERQGIVSFGEEVVEVSPGVPSPNGKVGQFHVVSRNLKTGETTTRIARHVVIAVGGKPNLPAEFPPAHPRVIHSSKYSTQVDTALPSKNSPYQIVVIGNGQSAAEIFNDLPSRYENAKVTLVIKGSSLRPSDDSPFVNEVFDPDRVNGIYSQSEEHRALAIAKDRATNYGVVRLELLEHLYQKLYIQRLQTSDPKDWKLRIKTHRQIVKTEETMNGRLLLTLQTLFEDGSLATESEQLEVDAVFVATGYERNAHEDILRNTEGLMRDCCQYRLRFPVQRNYKVDFDQDKVEGNAGVWLQGCNERTHGLSDSLLSILAVRGGELVESIFSGEGEVGMMRAKL